jgi:hypothetical protein
MAAEHLSTYSKLSLFQKQWNTPCRFEPRPRCSDWIEATAEEGRSSPSSSCETKPSQLASKFYVAAFEGCSESFSKKRTRSSVGFLASIGDSKNVVFSLIPSQSSAEEGLFFQAYTVRLGELAGLPREKIEEYLPQPLEPWAYASDMDKFWHGCTGYFKSAEQIRRFTNQLILWL